MKAAELVVINPGAADDQRQMVSQFYSKLANSGDDEVLNTMRGQIHHVIPLYLGGGHNAENLMRALGHAATAGTVHHLMHSLIDQTVVDAWVNNQKLSALSLDYNQLANRIPRDALRVIIGILFCDGRINYDDQACISPTQTV